MLFSTVTLFAFVISVLLYKLLESVLQKRKKFLSRLRLFGSDIWKYYNIAIICVLGMLFAIGLYLLALGRTRSQILCIITRLHRKNGYYDNTRRELAGKMISTLDNEYDNFDWLDFYKVTR